jgi:hypothetical protein
MSVQAQTCVPPDLSDHLKSLPDCLVMRSSSASAPLLLTPDKTEQYCRVPLETIPLKPESLTLPPLPANPADQGCLMLDTSDATHPILVLRAPKETASAVWSLKSGTDSVPIRAIPADLPGWQPKSADAIIHTYTARARDIEIQLQNDLVVNYGTAEITAVAPEVSGLKWAKLDLKLPVDALPTPPNLQVQLKNEYGQTSSVTLTLLPEARYSDSPSLQSLRIELAHMRKLVADEKFILARAADDGLLPQQSAADLKALYMTARSSLPPCDVHEPCDKLSNSQRATAALVRADIDYRTFLLDRRLTFWGGFRTLRPTTPYLELQKLQALRELLEKANDRMEKWQFTSTDASARRKELEAQKQFVLGQIKAEDLTADVKEINTNRWTQLKANNAASRAAIQQEMTQVSRRMEALARQQDALGKQATSLAMSAAASATGIPVDVIAGAADGDIKKAVASYVGSELANPNSVLSGELQQFGDALVEANGTFANLRATYKDIEGYKHNLELVAVTIREPSMERFLKVGELAYSKLDPAQVKKLNQMIESQKPVQAWLQASYYKVVAQKEQLETYRAALKAVAKEMDNLPKTVNTEVNTFLSEELKKAKGEGEDALRAAMARMLEGIKDLHPSGRRAEAILVIALKAYPSYISSVNTNLWYSLKTRHPGINDAQLLTYFLTAANETLNLTPAQREAYVKRVGMGFIDDGEFAINLPHNPKVFDVNRQIIQLAPKIDVSRIQLNAQAALESLLTTMGDNVPSERLMAFVATSASAESAGVFISRFVKKGDTTRMWNNLKTMPASFRADAENGVRYAMAASIASPAIPRPEAPALPDEPLIPQLSQQEQMQNQMVGMALNAAFPGAGTALQLAQTFGSMDANRQLNEQLAEQSIRLISAYQELVRSSQDADFSQAISLKEHDRAVALAEAAKAQLEQYNGAMDAILDTTQDADARLRLYRPYFFYLAEMLRQRFDIFDRSLAMWSGATDSRGFFATSIATDPTLARLALDSEIHLFDWLNRDREATKTDPFVLFVHWEQLVQLAQSYCDDHGCTPGDNRLGQIGTTTRVRVLANLAPPGTKEDFENWKRSGMPQPFKFRVTLDPSLKLVPAHFLNLRNLDWNAVPITRTGRIAGTLLSVRHLGHSRIPFEDDHGPSVQIGLRDESMLPNEFLPSNRADTFDSAALAARFQDNAPLRNLEGWGLYGAYELTVAPNPAITNVEDFEIELAYIYTDPGNVTSEQSFVARNTPAESTACGTSADPQTGESACRTIFYVSSDDCKTTPPLSSNRWLLPTAGLEFLRATQDGGERAPIKVCKTSAPVPQAKRAMDWQRATTQCNWSAANADIRAMDRDGSNAKLQCKELAL